jgi:hypothetical protein
MSQRANPAVQGTLRDKASRSAPDLERYSPRASFRVDFKQKIAKFRKKCY